MRKAMRIYVYVLAAVLYTPILVLALYSLSGSKYTGIWSGPTLKWYSVLLEDSEVWAALRNSLTVALASSLVSTLIGFLFAYAAVRRGFRLPFLSVYMYTPVVIPEIAEAVSLMLFFYYLAGSGVFGWLTVFIGHTAFNISYAYVTVRSQLEMLPPSIEDAAKSLGAGQYRLLRDIVLPLSAPGIIAAVMLTFITSFQDFVKTVFTTGPGFETLPLLVWSRARKGAASDLNALATLMVLWSLTAALLFSRKALGEDEKQGARVP